MSINNIIDQLKRDEGFRANVYVDTVGKLTIGYGHNLAAHPYPPYTNVTPELAEEILKADVESITIALKKALEWVEQLPEVYLGVLQNMAFNMGVVGLVGFHHMLTFMHDGDYSNASLAMTQSKWYTQVGDRAKRLVEQMKTGQWQ